MTTREGITCYERDEQLCDNPICMKSGCLMTDEATITPLQKLENRVAALEGTVAMLQAQLALLPQQQFMRQGQVPTSAAPGPNPQHLMGSNFYGTIFG